jgi:hypothetical protein
MSARLSYRTRRRQTATPGKRALYDPPPPVQATSVRGANPWPARVRCDESGDRAEWRPRRGLDPRAHSPASAAAGPGHHAAENLIHHRLGFLRVVPVRAGQAYGERDASSVTNQMTCTRAYFDPWDSDLSGHRRRSRGCNNCPRRPATNNLVVAREPIQERTGDQIPHTPARCQSRKRCQHVIPDPHASYWGASAREYRCEGRRQCCETRAIRDARPAARGRCSGIGNSGSRRTRNGSGAVRRSCLFTLPHRPDQVGKSCYNL